MEKNKKNQIKNIKIDDVQQLEEHIKKVSEKIDGFVYPLIIPPIQSIDEDILFEIYQDLKKIGKRDKLHVLLYSYGGDAHTAFHIGRLLQQYSENDLFIYVLREAKSAATLISCAADKIIFSDISELGPMDPQIRYRGTDDRFSPLAIKHAFDLLQGENKKGHIEIVKSLTERLPDPLILGEHLKSLETGKDYLIKLMRARMFNGVDDIRISEVAEKLVTGYPDHAYCIDYTEAKELGLKVEHIDDGLEDEIFQIMLAYKNIWDEFNQHIKAMKKANEAGDSDKEDEEFRQAASLHSDLKKITRSIIENQLELATNEQSSVATDETSEHILKNEANTTPEAKSLTNYETQ
ncbi:MAG: hypothetical protein WC159_11815 [Sphaerochaetaceae bacterium]